MYTNGNKKAMEMNINIFTQTESHDAKWCRGKIYVWLTVNWCGKCKALWHLTPSVTISGIEKKNTHFSIYWVAVAVIIYVTIYMLSVCMKQKASLGLNISQIWAYFVPNTTDITVYFNLIWITLLAECIFINVSAHLVSLNSIR